MSHQITAPRLEARGIAPAPPFRPRLSLEDGTRQVVQVLGTRVRLTVAATHAPEPAQFFYDFNRGDRTPTPTAAVKALVGIACDPRIPMAHVDVAVAELGSLLRSFRPLEVLPLRAYVERETQLQGPGDLATLRVWDAIERRDRAAIAAAIDAVSAHLVALGDLHVRLFLAQRELAA